MKKKILFVTIIIFSGIKAWSQPDRLHLAIQYSYALPQASLKKDVTEKASGRGAMMDLQYKINPLYSIGLGFGWQDYFEKFPRKLYQTGDNELTSGVLTNSVQIIPIMLKGRFYPLGNEQKSIVQPYLSAGAGFSLINFEQYLGQFGASGNKLGFSWQGGAGADMRFSKTSRAGFTLGAHYINTPYKEFGFGNFNSINILAGIYIPME